MFACRFNLRGVVGGVVTGLPLDNARVGTTNGLGSSEHWVKVAAVQVVIVMIQAKKIKTFCCGLNIDATPCRCLKVVVRHAP